MCLGVPGQILEITNDVALVDFWGTKKRIRVGGLQDIVVPGDYIIEHDGAAIRRIPVEEVADTLAMYEIILCEAGADPLNTDIVNELETSEELDLELV